MQEGVGVMERPDVFMPLYIGDYLAGTSRLTTELHGAYLLLIMDYWMNGPLPDDDELLASIVKMNPDAWSIARAKLEHFFAVCDGQWTQKRIEQELAQACEKKRKSKEKATNAAKARWNNAPSNASSTPQAMHDECPSPSPSPSPSEVNKSVKNNGPSGDEPARNKKSPSNKFTESEFEEFWKTCRENWHGVTGTKIEAKKEFLKLSHSSEDLTEITRLTLVECQARKRQNNAEGFAENMKHVCRWLKYRGWESVADRPRPSASSHKPWLHDSSQGSDAERYAILQEVLRGAS